MAIPWNEESVFESYDIIEPTFKTVASHEIKTAVLVPKGLKPGVHPVIYHIHGGFLVMGHGLFAPFFAKWVDKLALKNNAIIISPDYRLLPSANGLQDILEDVKDGWQWTKSHLPPILEDKFPGIALDFEHVLLVGGSAGGYCAAQLALSHPDNFKSLGVVYPLIDLDDRIWAEGPRSDEPTILRLPIDEFPSKEITLAWIEEKRQIPESRAGFERTPYAAASAQWGLFASHILDHKGLNSAEFRPLNRIEAGAKLPKTMWIMHGSDDSTVPIRASHKFVELISQKLPEVTVRFDVVPGQDHGFDFDEKRWASFEDEALGFVTEPWLA
ncbi:alpha beta hydrolase fold-3 [Fusarium heterosporum]|uniref:Alpha beta hydrolase fold-3 n=1 Tax=Fusarium heterosporum TaxID=42747 RepID=A0A8H5WXL0_FUSHE|nr:alpha beta hydrolase fold-3 [Fusarium heterosporum]